MIILQDTNDQDNGPECCGADFWLSILVGTPLLILGLIVGAFVVRYIVHKLIDGLASRTEETTPPDRLLGSKRMARAVFQGSGMYSARRAARAQTLASLFKSIATVIIFVSVVIMILGTLGVAVGPLIASAGIVGVALGFGAQSLVKDFLSGVMMMMEDQFGIGDVVDLGEATGIVEGIGMRVTRIRAIDGTVWYVRNGEVVRVGNSSQDWARAVVDVGVAYGENTARVRQLLLEVANELAADPQWGRLILEEPEVWGVEMLGADSVVVRTVVKTEPLEQWGVSRELKERIKNRFDAEGIEIPFPQRTVWHRGTVEPPAPAPASEPESPAPSKPRTSSARQPEPEVET
ncbi:MAG TPA: mechanosensitive ion channel family protein [Jiangellaceae bacterium]